MPRRAGSSRGGSADDGSMGRRRRQRSASVGSRPDGSTGSRRQRLQRDAACAVCLRGLSKLKEGHVCKMCDSLVCSSCSKHRKDLSRLTPSTRPTLDAQPRTKADHDARKRVCTMCRSATIVPHTYASDGVDILVFVDTAVQRNALLRDMVPGTDADSVVYVAPVGPTRRETSAWVGMLENRRVAVVHATSLSSVRRAVFRWRPRLCAVLDLCHSLAPDAVAIADVLVASEILRFQSDRNAWSVLSASRELVRAPSLASWSSPVSSDIAARERADAASPHAGRPRGVAAGKLLADAPSRAPSRMTLGYGAVAGASSLPADVFQICHEPQINLACLAITACAAYTTLADASTGMRATACANNVAVLSHLVATCDGTVEMLSRPQSATLVHGHLAPLPDPLVARTDLIDMLRRHILTPGLSITVSGDAGSGKSTLLSAVLHEGAVLADFPDGVFILSAGGTDTRDVTGMQVHLLALLLPDAAPPPYGATDPDMVAALLARALCDRRCLIVVDGVVALNQVQSYHGVVGSNTTLVFVSDLLADPSRADSQHPVMQVPPLSREEAHHLLREVAAPHWFDEQVHVHEMLATLSGDLRPGLIRVLGHTLRRAASAAAWRSVLGSLRERRNDTSSVRVLRTASRDLPSRVRTAWHKLRVLPCHVAVPIAITAALWRCENNGMAVSYAKALADRGFLSFSQADMTVELHPATLQPQASNTEMRSWHASMIDHLSTLLTSRGQWASIALDRSSEYYWKHLITHMLGAERYNDAVGALLQWSFLDAQMRHVGLLTTLADLRRAAVHDPVLEQLASAMASLRASRQQSPSSSDLAFVLLSHFLQARDKRLAALVRAARHNVVGGMLPLHALEPSNGLVTVLSGHTDYVTCVCVLADNAHIASGSRDSTIRIWLWKSAAPAVRVIRAHQGWVRSLACTSDGRLLSCGDDAALRVWLPMRGQRAHEVTNLHASVIRCVAVSTNNRVAATGGSDMLINLVSLVDYGVLRKLRGHTDRVEAVVFTPQVLVSSAGFQDGSIRIWNTETGECVHQLQHKSDGISAMTYIEPSNTLISGGGDGSIDSWSLASMEHLTSLASAGAVSDEAVVGLATSTDASALFAAGGSSDQVRVWDVARPDRPRGILRAAAHRALSCLASIDPAHVVIGSHDHTLLVRRWIGADVMHSGDFADDDHDDDGDDSKVRVASSPAVLSLLVLAGAEVVAGGTEDNRVMVWDVRTGQLLQQLPGHTASVLALAQSIKTPALIASASADGSVRIWDWRKARTRLTMRGYAGQATCLAYRPASMPSGGGGGGGNGEDLAVGYSDWTIRLWNAATGQQLCVLFGHGAGVLALTWSRDATRLITSAGDAMLFLWDPASQSKAAAFPTHRSLRSLVLLPDGEHVLASGYDRGVSVWRWQSGQRMRTLSGHTGRVRDVIHVAGRRDELAVSCSPSHRDASLRAWDLAAALQRAVLHAPVGRPLCLASGVHQDGQPVVVAGLDTGQVVHVLLPAEAEE